MKRVLIAAAVAAVVAVPAVIGLWGNASFSQAVPVRAPESGQVVTPSPGSTSGSVDDHGGDTPRDQRTEPGDDRDVQGVTPPSQPAPSPSASTPGSTSGTVDDHGGDTPRDQRTEPGDDRSGSGSSGSASSGSSGDDGADDHGGHGSDH